MGPCFFLKPLFVSLSIGLPTGRNSRCLGYYVFDEEMVCLCHLNSLMFNTLAVNQSPR